MATTPVHVIKEEKCQAAIWKNTRSDNDTHYYTVSFQRRYKGTGDETKYTSSFGLYDIPHLVVLAGKSMTWVWKQALKDREKEQPVTA